MKVKLKTTILNSGEIHIANTIFDSNNQEFPKFLQDLIDEKSEHLEIIEEFILEEENSEKENSSSDEGDGEKDADLSDEDDSSDESDEGNPSEEEIQNDVKKPIMKKKTKQVNYGFSRIKNKNIGIHWWTQL